MAQQKVPLSVRIVPVRDSRQRDLFVSIPHRLRRHHVLWTPQLRRDVRNLIDPKRHPFHQHAEVQCFLAFEEKRCVGRIAAIENHAHNSFHEEQVGFFGLLDAEPRAEIFAALLGAAEQWCQQRGLKALRGPASLSTNEECGLLVDGFDAPPTVMTPWNPPEWVPLVEKAGYTKAKDLLSWLVTEDSYVNRIESLADKIREKLQRTEGNIVTRPLRMKEYEAELENFRIVYNSAWEKNWGFVPMTRAEIDHMAKELRPLIIPELVQFAEINGKPVGMCLAIPDYNFALRHMDGKLGWREILLFLLMKSRIRRGRLITLGVVSEYRQRGLEALLVNETIKASRNIGLGSMEMGWILEDNQIMNRIIQSIGSTCYRTHRIYEKSLVH